MPHILCKHRRAVGNRAKIIYRGDGLSATPWMQYRQRIESMSRAAVARPLFILPLICDHGQSALKIDRHLSVDLAPVLLPSCPLFGNVHHSQIEHFQQTVIGRKHCFGFGNFTKLAVKPLNGIGLPRKVSRFNASKITDSHHLFVISFRMM